MPQVFATLEDLDLRAAHPPESLVLPSLPKPMQRCPQQKFISYGIFYRNEALPGMDICSRCYNDYILDTFLGQLEGGFSSAAATPANPRNCDFNTPRVLLLWSIAVRQDSLDGLQIFWTRRKRISPCAGKAGLQGAAAHAKKWFTAAAIDGFLVCETCYEDRILASPFSSLFEPLKRKYVDDDETWVCDLSLPYITRALKRYTETSDWHSFVDATIARLHLRPCARDNAVAAASRSWFTTRREIPGLCICESCFYDWFALTRHEEEFELYPNDDIRPGEAWRCDLAVPKLKIACNALEMDACPFDTWWQAARAYVVTKPCPSDGVIKDSPWYVLATHEANFGVCPSCFYAIVRPMGTALQTHFKLVEYPPGSVSTCGFASRSPRFKLYVEKLEEALNSERPEVFTGFIIAWADIPPCPRDVPKSNRRWWGSEDFTICEECAEVLGISRASFATRLRLRGDRIAARASCDAYGPRLRRLCEKAVDRGDYEEFREIIRYRKS